MSKAKELFTNWRVILLLIAILLSIVSIYPNPYKQGVAIRSVTQNSSAMIAGMLNPSQTIQPMFKETIISINNVKINSPAEYEQYVATIEPDRAVTIVTSKTTYHLTTKPKIETTYLNETEKQTIESMEFYNETVDGVVVLKNKTTNKTIEVPKTETKIIGTEDLGLKVYVAPTSNIRKGLDLQGGTRVVLAPETEITKDDMDILIANMKERLNVYGLSDLTVAPANDLSGQQYIIVEIAGATEEEVQSLLAKQGKFEAKVGNITVFKGGSNSVKYVCRSADCSGIDPNYGCRATTDGGSMCRFRFSITLSPEAAQAEADATKDLQVITENKDQYLSQKLELYLDDEKVDELNIAADLKGKVVTEIAISGSGIGPSQQEAITDSQKNMKRLQTILITGSLPVKLKIIKADTISPVLGDEFVRNALFIGFLAWLSVCTIVFLRYRRFKIVLPMGLALVTEVVMILGVAASIRWNLDLAAIAGIIITVGTGVDHLVIITDEVLRGEKGATILNWKQKIANAFAIILTAFATVVAGMIPLLWAGAGLLKGFAITTIIGLALGVFIARPAFSAIIQILLKE